MRRSRLVQFAESYRNSGLNCTVIRQKRPELYRKSGFGQAELYRNCFGTVGLTPYLQRRYGVYHNPTIYRNPLYNGQRAGKKGRGCGGKGWELVHLGGWKDGGWVKKQQV
jgi:hypothetical protein